MVIIRRPWYLKTGSLIFSSIILFQPAFCDVTRKSLPTQLKRIRGGSSIFGRLASSLTSKDQNDSIMSDPDKIIGGGAINEKKRQLGAPENSHKDTNQASKSVFQGRTNQANFLHAMEGLDRYPNYVSRWSMEEIDELEKAMEERLERIRQQKESRQERQVWLDKIVSQICERDPEWRDFLEAPKTWEEARSRLLDERAEKAIFRSNFFRANETRTVPPLREVLNGSAKVELDAGYLEELMDEEAYDVYSFPVLSQSFCKKLQDFIRCLHEEVERGNETDTKKSFRVVHNLDLIGLSWLNDFLFHLITRPISRHLYQHTEMGGSSEDVSGQDADLDWRHGFIAAYSARPDEHKPRQRLVPHTDDAEVTLNVCFGDTFEGGDLRLWGLRGTDGELLAEYTPEVGRALLHAGRQLHEVTEVTSGDRFALIMWTRSWSGIRSSTCPCCWLNRRTGSDLKNCVCGRRWN